MPLFQFMQNNSSLYFPIMIDGGIVDTQYNYALRPRERNSNIRGTSTNRFKNFTSKKYALCFAHDQFRHYFAIICLLVANTTNCFLAIHFVLLDYYCLLGRLVIQLFLLQEVLINISTYPHLKRFEGIADICVAAILTSKPAFLDYVKCVSVNL